MKLSENFDQGAADPLGDRNIIKVESERGFLTITGTYKGTSMSVVSIGMGVSYFSVFRGRFLTRLLRSSQTWTSLCGSVENVSMGTCT